MLRAHFLHMHHPQQYEDTGYLICFLLYFPCSLFGVWRSWLARSVRDAEVGGSSPLTPTIQDILSLLQFGEGFLI
jgi:hypothetical protein